MELVDGDGFPRPEQQTVPIRRQALVPESLEAIRPISSPKQSACHGPELSLFTLQRLLQVEKPATFRHSGQSRCHRLADALPHGGVLAERLGVQLRVAPRQIEPVHAEREVLIIKRAEKCQFRTVLPQEV